MASKNGETRQCANTNRASMSVTCEKPTMTSIATQISTINVPFHGDNLSLVSFNGQPHVPMKPVVEGMGLAWQPQHEKLKTRFSKGITEIVIPTKGGDQSMTCYGFPKLVRHSQAKWCDVSHAFHCQIQLLERV
ncbi:phage antirepressor N-terminal domain-containing protein, partial [Serratia ficaria]